MVAESPWNSCKTVSELTTLRHSWKIPVSSKAKEVQHSVLQNQRLILSAPSVKNVRKYELTKYRPTPLMIGIVHPVAIGEGSRITGIEVVQRHLELYISDFVLEMLH
jgi:hypothetical protein